jgi:hypothetical protein
MDLFIGIAMVASSIRFFISFPMKRNETKKNPENLILPPTRPTLARAKFSVLRAFSPGGEVGDMIF